MRDLEDVIEVMMLSTENSLILNFHAQTIRNGECLGKSMKHSPTFVVPHLVS